jgi:hypothetical protein
MSCPSVLTCARYADGALAPEEAAMVAEHTEACADCRRRVALLADETHALRMALRAGEASVEVPSFAPPISVAALLGWTLAAALGLSVVAAQVAAAELPRWLSWLAPDALGVGIDLAFGTLRLMFGGEPIAAIATSGGSLMWLAALTAALGAWLLTRQHPRRATPLCVSLCAATLLLGQAPASHAFEIRRDEDQVTIAADEVIDDTLIVAADLIIVEGTVTGDLIAVGERVTLRGDVGGVLVAAAEELTISSNVESTVLGLGKHVEFWGAQLGGNAFSAARRVTVSADSTIAGGASLTATEAAEMRGQVARDFVALAKGTTMLGSVGGDMTAYGARATLGAGAQVGGDLNATVKHADELSVSSQASVGGETTVTIWEEEPSKYLTAKFYVTEALKLVAAFISGLVLFLLLPGLRDARLDRGVDALVTAGWGAIGLIAVPALAVVTVFTIIGAPLGIIALLLWLVSLYAAGIVVAALLGQRLFADGGRSEPLMLLVGLSIVFVLINLPFVGDMMQLLVLVVGLGLIVQWARGVWDARPA